MYCFDTCICIEFMRGRMPAVYERLRQSDPRMYKIPAVVEAELRLGALKSSKAQRNTALVEQFLLPFEVVPFDSRCAIEYASIRASLERSGSTIGPNDLMIAAIVRANGGVLVTDNVREFQRVPGLRIENWAEAEL